MSTSKKIPQTDRGRGGPGSSHQDATDPADARRERGVRGPLPGQPTNPPRSRVSGGGGEIDRHHRRSPSPKGH